MGAFTKLIVAALAETAVLTRLRPELAPLSSSWATLALLLTVQYLGWLVYRSVIYPHYLSPLRNLPEPQNNGFLSGQFGRILKETAGDPMREWIQTIPNDGLIRYRHLFNRERVLLASPKALAEVLVQRNYEFIKPPQFRQDLATLLGEGVLLAEGDEHKRQRRMLLPAFSYRHIKDLYPVFWTKSREVVLKMRETMTAAKGQGVEAADVLEVSSWASRVTLDIIGVAGMGRDFGAIQDPSSELSECYRHVFDPSRRQRRLAVIAMFVPFWILWRLPIKRNSEIREARALIRRVAKDLIDEKKAKLEKSTLEDVDILSVALTSGGFSDENLIDQVMTMLAAGHHTTSSALTWACYLLCKYPEIQRRLRLEIQTHLPSICDENSTVSAEDVDKLPYLHACVQEILRLIPPVPLTMRVAAHDSSILGQPVPKDTMVLIAPWAVNHSTELWGPDAGEFNPDRWMGEGRVNTGGADSNYSFLTFLHGPRSCIGEKFSKAEFSVLLAAWAGTFEMDFEDKDYVLDIVGGITARPRGGLRVRMSPTNW